MSAILNQSSKRPLIASECLEEPSDGLLFSFVGWGVPAWLGVRVPSVAGVLAIAWCGAC